MCVSVRSPSVGKSSEPLSRPSPSTEDPRPEPVRRGERIIGDTVQEVLLGIGEPCDFVGAPEPHFKVLGPSPSWRRTEEVGRQGSQGPLLFYQTLPDPLLCPSPAQDRPDEVDLVVVPLTSHHSQSQYGFNSSGMEKSRRVPYREPWALRVEVLGENKDVLFLFTQLLISHSLDPLH